MGDASKNNLETEELSKLADVAEEHGVSGKFSGAGGGDCGIAVCFDGITAEKIKQHWKETGLYPIDIKISRTGLKEE